MIALALSPVHFTAFNMSSQDAHEEPADASSPVPPALPPSSPRQIRTQDLLLAHPGLSIPEAMRAACYTVEQSESAVLQSLFEETLAQAVASNNKNNKNNKSATIKRRPPGMQEIHPTKRSAPMSHVDPSTLPPDIVLCTVRPKNAAGRCLCRVEGCRKLDQANNNGFCRAHYNIIHGCSSSGAEGGVGGEDGADGDATGTTTGTATWTCDACNSVVASVQKRCGNCHRWRDGKRDSNASSHTAKALGNWTCDCGNVVSESKSRCGKCHHWKGGKRNGGWKLGAKKMDVDDIDRTQDWECCGEVIPAAKTRCGKCRKWRGGKRQIRWSYHTAPPQSNTTDPSSEMDEQIVDPNVDWTCKVESCRMINKGTKKRCSECFSWRFSRKKPRMSTGMMKDESAGMTLDHLDALVNEEIQRHEGDGIPVVMTETVNEEVVDETKMQSV